MALEMDSDRSICYRCGTAYGRRKGNFPVCYAGMYRGTGYLPFCRNCVDTIYNEYFGLCGDQKLATRQTCRKLDLYWNEQIYESVSRKSTTRTMMTNYIQRVNNISYAGKSYDDSLIADGTMWKFDGLEEDHEEQDGASVNEPISEKYDTERDDDMSMEDIPKEVVDFWGPGYTPKMYMELEQRLQYYRGQMGEDARTDLGTDTLLRQIAMLEIDINRARASGRSVDKMVSSMNSLLSSLNRPQKNAAIDSAAANTPFGVWIKRWEDERPLPEIDDSLKDTDGIIKYVLTWVYGHMAHMLKIKNARTPLYDDAISNLRVEHPEYDDEDDETLLYDLFGDGGTDADTDE